MHKKVLQFLSCLVLWGAVASHAEITFNENRAVIFGPQQEKVVITTLDIRPSLNGEPRTLRDIVLHELKIFDARTLAIKVTDEEIEKFIKELQKMNNCGPEQIEGLFKALGYTLKEGKEQLRHQQEIEQVQSYRLRNKMPALKPGDVEAYWQEHGEREEATFTLLSAFVPSTMHAAEFENAVRTKTLKQTIVWNEPFTIKAKDLPKDKEFIKQGEVGTIVFVEPVSGGFEVTKLKEKTEDRLIPLKSGNTQADEKRYKAIEATIREKRYKAALAEYEADLLEQAKKHIKFMHEADRKAVYGY